MSIPNIQIYSTPTCGFCKQAKEFLAENNVPFVEYNVAADAEKRNELVEKRNKRLALILGLVALSFYLGFLISNMK
ncbi:MAG: glutaredoxin domain-containing protein [Minisyncoccia bacterium]